MTAGLLIMPVSYAQFHGGRQIEAFLDAVKRLLTPASPRAAPARYLTGSSTACAGGHGGGVFQT